jgi:hypothetical protein
MYELAAALALVWFSGFLLGIMALLFYILWRMMRSDGWDDSNITNALRLLSHVALHPEDFGKMYYLTGFDGESAHIDRRPFWYVSKDEFEGVVKTRPPQ